MSSRASASMVGVFVLAVAAWLRGMPAHPAAGGGATAVARPPSSAAATGAGAGVDTGIAAGREAGPAGAGAAAAGADDAADAPWRRPVAVVERFFGLPAAPLMRRADAVLRLRAAVEAPGLKDVQVYKLKLLIALVPDPLDSQLPAAFDQELDALEQGFAYSSPQRPGYLPDRRWLPWQDAAAAQGKSYRTTPGLMLFRQEDGPVCTLTAVLLVGETSTAGLHMAAFHEALRLAADLADGEEEPVRILGPSFSGTASSLRVALLQWGAEGRLAAPPPPHFVIVTGTAKAPCLESQFQLPAPTTVAFYRTQASVDVLLGTALTELHRQLGWDLSRAALIAELETAYGASVPQPGGKPHDDCQETPLPPGVQVVRFPGQLAAIRSARAAAGLGKTPPADSPAADSPAAVQPAPSDLQIDAMGGPPASGAAAGLSPLTSSAGDLALSGLVQGLSRIGVQYAGIMATDVRDTLLLADRIHTQAPNMALFVVDGDLLFVHPQVNTALEGMTVISSAPLFAAGRSFGSGAAAYGRLPWQLSSSFAQGIYQATVALLSPIGLEWVVRREGSAVWLSVVGNDALWPISGVVSQPGVTIGHAAASNGEKVLSFSQLGAMESSDWRDDPGAGARLVSGSMPVKADLELLVFAVALCAGAWSLRRAALLPAPPGGGAAANGTRWLLAGGLALLALAAAALLVLDALPHWTWLRASPVPVHWTFAGRLAFAGTALAYVLLSGMLLRAATGWRPAGGGTAPSEPAPRRRLAAAAPLVLTLMGIAAAPALLWWICAHWMLYTVDFDLRIRSFDSGLSPLVSLAWLVAALFLWVLFELQRRRLTNWQQIDWPLAAEYDPAFQGCEVILGAIRWLLCVALPRRAWRRIALAAVALAFLGLTWNRVQPAAEAQQFGRLLLAAWGLAALLSAVSCYRFLRVWQTLSRLLLRLESTPLAARLKALSGDLHWKPMQAFSSPIPPFQTLILSFERLKALLRAGKLALTPDESRKLLQDLDESVGLAFAAESRDQAVEEIASREKVQQIIATASRGLLPQRDDPDVADFFAIRAAAYVRYIFAQLRSLLLAAIAPGLLLLVAGSAYTFQPRGIVSFGILALVVGEIAIAVAVFVQMNRDTVLSFIAGNDPGEVTFDWHFISSLLTFGVVPLLGLVATQVPAAGQLLNGWLKPLLRLAGG
jgi:hypothetical protein